MVDVFPIDDIGGDGLQNDALSEDEADLESFHRWVWMRFVSSEIYFKFFLLARQMIVVEGKGYGCCIVTFKLLI